MNVYTVCMQYVENPDSVIIGTKNTSIAVRIAETQIQPRR